MQIRKSDKKLRRGGIVVKETENQEYKKTQSEKRSYSAARKGDILLRPGTGTKK